MKYLSNSDYQTVIHSKKENEITSSLKSNFII